jgi:signal transduction histidine kinase
MVIMEQDAHLSAYRQRLLESLHELPKRRREERPDALQVFVNHECVGSLNCRSSDPTFVFASRERSIHSFEVRTETGMLLGGISAPELGLKSQRLAWPGYSLDVTIHNRLEGGSLRVAYAVAPAWWRRLGRAASSVLPATGPATGAPAFGLRAMLLAQVVLLGAVTFLIGDRLFDRMQQTEQTIGAVQQAQQDLASAVETQAQDTINRLEAKVNQVLQAQASSVAVAEGNQKAITIVQRAMDELAQQQRLMGTQVVSVQHMEEHQERVARQANLEVERMAKVMMSQVQTDREELRDELHSLSLANEHLAKQVSSLEKKNQDLVNRLKTAGVDVSSRIRDAGDAGPMLAKERERAELAPSQMQVAEARPDGSPLKFFVSFHDGTSEESIDRWLQEIQARKGDLDSGWYSVELAQPTQQPADRFLESIKTAKIIKAVAKSRTRLPAR